MPPVENIDPHTVKKWIDDGSILLVDVREREEVADGFIADAKNIPMSEYVPESVPVGGAEKIVFYCHAGMRSMMALRAFLASQELAAQSYNMDGGFSAWKEAGLPVAYPAGEGL